MPENVKPLKPQDSTDTSLGVNGIAAESVANSIHGFYSHFHEKMALVLSLLRSLLSEVNRKQVKNKSLTP